MFMPMILNSGSRSRKTRRLRVIFSYIVRSGQLGLKGAPYQKECTAVHPGYLFSKPVAFKCRRAKEVDREKKI